MKEKINLSNGLVWIVLFLFGTSFLGQLTGISINEVIYFLITVIIMITNNTNLTKKFLINILYIILFGMYGLLLLLKNDSGIGSIYTALTGLTVVLAFQKVKFTKTQEKLLFLILLIGNVFWNINSPDWYEKYMYALKHSESIINPNGVGYFICFSAIYIFIIVSEKQNKFFQYIKWAVIIWSIKGILNVHARMALVMYILFFAFKLIIKLFKNKKIILNIMLISALMIEILFPAVYIALYRMNFGKSYLFMGVTEKGLYSGREDIWIRAFNGMKNIGDWLFGVGSKQNYWVGHSLNMHNNAMHLLVVFGIVGLIAYFVFIIYFFNSEFDFENFSTLQLDLMIFFIIILVGGSSDIMLFYNDFMLLVFVPFALACNKKYNLELWNTK